jgi:hypothetical protein
LPCPGRRKHRPYKNMLPTLTVSSISITNQVWFGVGAYDTMRPGLLIWVFSCCCEVSK